MTISYVLVVCLFCFVFIFIFIFGGGVGGGCCILGVLFVDVVLVVCSRRNYVNLLIQSFSYDVIAVTKVQYEGLAVMSNF
jgi:hypothetical protein